MRIITRRALREFWERHPEAEPPLRDWEETAKRAAWRNIMEVRREYPHADATDKTASGRTVTIFNIGGGKYRLVTAIHYNVEKIFTLRIMTHAQYSKEAWKRDL